MSISLLRFFDRVVHLIKSPEGEMPRSLPQIALIAVIGALIASCGQTRPIFDPENPQSYISELNRVLIDDPQNVDALVELGIVHLRLEQPSRAGDFLQQAYGLRGNDARIVYYLGLSQEALGNERTALRFYEMYPRFSRLAPYRRLLEGRYSWLVRRAAEREAQELAMQEAERAEVNPRILAVFPLQYTGTNPRYEAIGRGISEMVAVDLTNVRDLVVVERVRLQALLDEIALGETGYVDPATAPRAGRLLGAGRIVAGSYNILARDNLRVDAALWDVDRPAAPDFRTQTDILNNIFRLQKTLVFSILDDIGIELTPAEREALERVPTQNLRAFMAYSQGLQLEDEGRFALAARQFIRASALDPQFEAAAEAAGRAEGLRDAGGSVDDALSAALAIDGPAEPISALSERSSHLYTNINNSFLPGQESRRAAEEVVNILVTLPEPPPPPVRD